MSASVMGTGDCSRLCPFVFRNLPPELVEKLRGISSSVHLKSGETLIWRGEVSPTIYWIKSGLIKLTEEIESGKTQTFSLCGPERLVGAESLFQRKSPLTSEAILPTYCCAIPISVFRGVIESSASLALDLLEYYQHELERAYRRITTMAHYSTDRRLASLLCELACSQESDGYHVQRHVIELGLTQSQIAEVVGASRVSVSKAINSLRRQMIIDCRHKVFHLLDAERLISIVTGNSS